MTCSREEHNVAGHPAYGIAIFPHFPAIFRNFPALFRNWIRPPPPTTATPPPLQNVPGYDAAWLCDTQSSMTRRSGCRITTCHKPPRWLCAPHRRQLANFTEPISRNLPNIEDFVGISLSTKSISPWPSAPDLSQVSRGSAKFARRLLCGIEFSLPSTWRLSSIRLPEWSPYHKTTRRREALCCGASQKPHF